MNIRETKIRFKNVMDIQRFVRLPSKYEINADVFAVNNGRHVVPVDSIMGIFSLDLTQELRVVFVAGEDDNIMKFIIECEEAGWIVK